MKTKIVATVGPASSSKETLKKMILAGVNVFRLNFSHGEYHEHLKIIKNIKELNKELNTHIAMLADLQGPKIRIGQVKNNGINLKKNQEIIFTTDENNKDDNKIFINYKHFPKDVKPKEKILVDDGKILFEIISTDRKKIVKAKVLVEGILSSRKGVNLPNTAISLPCLTEKDFKDIEFIVKNKFQWIGLSFVRSASDIVELKQTIEKYKIEKHPLIIAKIEKSEALKDIDNIIKESDALMVARGDLGVETPLEQLPLIQKMIVKKCLKASKPTIIATQMMEGMITNIIPSRAEVNDVANSVLDGADALMLSGETSVGQFPVEVVKTMKKIIDNIESYTDIYYKHYVPQQIIHEERFISDSILYNACELAQQSDAKAIIAMTYSGYSAYKISSQRPKSKIYIFTNNHSLLSKLNLVWGVEGFYYNKFISTDNTIEDIKKKLQLEKKIKKGDLVINIASTPIKKMGRTNMLKLSYVD